MIILPHHKRHRPPLVLSPYHLHVWISHQDAQWLLSAEGMEEKLWWRVLTGWRLGGGMHSGSYLIQHTHTHTTCSNTPVKPETLRWRPERLGSGEGPLRTFLRTCLVPFLSLALLFSRLAHPSVSVFTPDRTPACSVLIIKSPLGVLVCVAQHVCVCVCADTCVYYLSAPMCNYFHETEFH